MLQYTVTPAVEAQSPEAGIFSNLPGKCSFPQWAGYLYVVEMNSGLIKVGLTTNPRARLQQHDSMARAHGAFISRFWLSPETLRFRELEKDLIAYCSESCSGMYRNEYFEGLEFEDVRDFAESLDLHEPDHEELKKSVKTLVYGSEYTYPPVDLRHEDEIGEYWTGRELYELFGYATWQQFARLVKVTSDTLALSGDEFHVQATTRSVPRGTHGAKQDQADYRFTRHAANVLAMCADTGKTEVAKAKSFLASRLAH